MKVYSENDLFKAFQLFEEGYGFEDVVNYFNNNKRSLFDKDKMDLIIDSVLTYFKISIELFESKSRVRNVVDARYMYYFLCRKHTKNSLTAIGEKVNRGHATVLNGLQYVKDMLFINDAKIKKDIEGVTGIYKTYLAIKQEETNKEIEELCTVKEI